MAPRYGDFTFDSSSGFTGSVKRKAFKCGGYAEGGMRSERTQVAKASREVQDNAMAPAKQLNKSLKNLYNTRKQTGYETDEMPTYAGGGLHKMRSDKGVTGEVPGVKMGRSGSKMPGMLPPMNAGPKLNKPVDATTSSPLSRIAMKRGGKAKK